MGPGYHKSSAHTFNLLMYFRILIPAMIFMVVCSQAFAQGTGVVGPETGFTVGPDTVPEVDADFVPTEKVKLFSGRPGKAALYSLILPGAGQAYNGKYWQVPIVWGAVGGMGYLVIENTKMYNGYKEAYRDYLIAEMEGTAPEIDPKFDGGGAQQTLNYRNQWNRYRQLAIIGFAAVWLAQSAQAYVSAHLQQFDIGDDLSMQIIPSATEPLPFPSMPLSASVYVRF